MDLDVQLDTTDGRRVLHVRGSIDIASRDRLARTATSSLPDPDSTTSDDRDLVLDLAGVTFVDSTGIGTLVALDAEVEERGGRLVLRNPSRPVVRILEVAGLAERWFTSTDH